MSVDSLTTSIETAATDPQSVSVDGQTVTERSLQDQIAAARFVAGQKAVADAPAKRALPFRSMRLVPPGAS